MARFYNKMKGLLKRPVTLTSASIIFPSFSRGADEQQKGLITMSSSVGSRRALGLVLVPYPVPRQPLGHPLNGHDLTNGRPHQMT